MRRVTGLPLGLLGLGWLAPFPSAQQTLQPVLRERETIIGLGAVQNATEVYVNNSRMWTALVDTTAPIEQDLAIVRNGFVTLREGAAFTPPGFRVTGWDSFYLNNAGDLAMVLKVNSAAVGDTEGLYFNAIPVALRGGAIDSPLVPGARWDDMFSVKLNDKRQLILLCQIDNPATPASFESTLARFQLDAGGNVTATEILATRGQFVPELGDFLQKVPNSAHGVAINNHGDFIVQVTTLATLDAILLNMTEVLAIKGGTAPVPGGIWKTLSNGPRLSINDRGEYVFSGTLEGDTFLIVKNGEKFAFQGDVLDELSESPLARGSAAPYYIANTGDVFWRAETDAGDEAFMRNHTPIVINGVTTVSGVLVSRVEPSDNAFHVSTDGRFWIGRIELQNQVGRALVMADFGLVLPIPGCTGNAATLTVESAEPLAGGHLTLAMDQGQTPGVRPILLFSTRARIPGSECGVNTPAGELLISTSNVIARLIAPPWNGTPTRFDLPIPADPSLIDVKLWIQGYFRDVGGLTPEDFRLTNGLRVEIGAP